MSAAGSSPVRIHLSYAATDDPLRVEIEKRLYSLPERTETFALVPGKTESHYLSGGDIVLLLVSKEYLSSASPDDLRFFTDPEILDQVRVLKIELEEGISETGLLQALPLLASRTDGDKTPFYDAILSGLESLIELMRNKKAADLIREETGRKTRTLDLSHCDLKKVPFDLKQMPWLETLVLEFNKLERMEHLEQSGNLKQLRLANNKIQKIEQTEHLQHLELLDMHENALTKVSNLEKNTRLHTLGLSGNQLETLEGIGHLKHLDTLYAAHNQLQSLEALAHMPSLRRIVLTNNPLTSLRPLKKHIRNGMEVSLKYSFDLTEPGLFVEDCPRLAEPSLEVIRQGRPAILKYFNEAETIGTRKLELIKLILVGNSRVGKTDLSEFLRTGKVSGSSSSTHLLDIREWDAPFLRSEQGGLTRVNIFDFGGQDYYHDAHRMYYSYDTAYILLWDTLSNKYDLKEEQVADREDVLQYEDFPLEYWLESIRYNLGKSSFDNYYHRGGEADSNQAQAVAPVLVIQNKIDLAEGLLDQSGLQLKYPNIKQFFNLSLREKKRTAVLEEVISDYMNALNLSGRLLLQYEYDLVELFRQRSAGPMEILSLETFGDRCRALINNEEIVFNEDNAAILAQVLNNTGIFFFDRYTEGEGNIYTNIRELNERVKLIMDIARRGNEKGIFYGQETENVPGNGEILDLLCRNNSIIRISNDRYIAPQFLPVKPDSAIAFFLQAFTFTQIRYVYKAYFHKSLLLNLFARYLDKENVDTAETDFRFLPFWRNGIIIKRENSSRKEWVLVEFEKNKEAAVGIVNIRTMKPFSKSGLEKEIERSLDELNAGWTVEKQVSVNSSDFFCVEDLQHKVKEKQFVFYKNDSIFSVRDFSQIVSFEKLPKKLFISYSSRNAEFVKRFVTHLDVLKANGDIEPWYDRMIGPGTQWDESIRAEMGRSDVVIFLLSPDFLATEYIMKTEIPLAIKQAEQGGINFFFIQLQDCLWDRTDLGKFQQTGDKAQEKKNIITIGRPDNDSAWLSAIKALEELMAGTPSEKLVTD